MKGDYVRILIETVSGPIPVEVKATKAGRKVVRKNRTAAKVLWLDVAEVTRFGRPTGTNVSVRQSAILSISEFHDEEPV